ncbi:MAG: RIP metalloprotease RseP [Deltaproteobacteria bacterium]|nr:RIP metalloprotease RseP [Deltaproteobacteria bacterium]
MDLLYFIILVSSLVFVHELGHFVVAKTFGVKVLTFSLGFGPKVVRFRGKETEYCIGLFPLGGFVKMLEERKDEPVLPEDAKRTFDSQPIWKRTLIVSAGPVMNLAFPVLLYFVAFLADREFLPPTVGIVLPDHPADGKLQPGDRIMAINGTPISTYAEFNRTVRHSPGKELQLRVFRDLGYVTVSVTPEEVEETHELGIRERIGRVGVLPGSPAATVGISSASSPAWRAGLRTFDMIIQVADMPVKRLIDLERVFENNRGETVPVAFLRPKPVVRALDGLCDMAVFEHGVSALTPDPNPGDLLARTGFESSDLYAAVVPEGSAEDQAHLRAGDKIIEVDGHQVLTWHSMQERLLAAPDKPHEMTWLHEDRRMSGTIQMRRVDWVDEYGAPHSRFVLRTMNWLPFAVEPLVPNPHPMRWAFRNALEETRDVMRFISIGLVRLVQGKMSLSALSGPLTIYEVAGQEGEKGTSHFLWVMALVSINLGLLNLLPIPVLDGGHLLFFLSEGVLRRPLPLRVREVASIVGMTFLFVLIGIAFKNDVERRWDVILSQIKELFG